MGPYMKQKLQTKTNRLVSSNLVIILVKVDLLITKDNPADFFRVARVLFFKV